MNMNKMYFLFISIFFTIFLTSCRKYLQVDKQILQTKIYEPTVIHNQSLRQSTVLYLDHSTCVIDARKNSNVFKKLIGQLGLYTDTLCLIKKDILEKIPNTDKSPTSTDVYNIINGISEDIKFADIGKAIEEISKSNSQSILITDFEYFDKNGKNQDGFPYLSGAFKSWLEKGHSIYIITEPYKEGGHDKKRFYVIFTDDKLQAPISSLLRAEIQDLLKGAVCTWFKMTNSDIEVESPKGDMVCKTLSYNVDYLNGFELITIDDSWDAIREYVMKLNEYNEPVPEEKPEPLISNLIFNDGENYKISDIQIVATNITTKYISKDTIAADDLGLDVSTINPTETNISDGFILDKEALKSNKLNVMLTDAIFTDGHLFDKYYGGNLIRLDFVITQVGLNPINQNDFEWPSIWSPNNAICVSKSIDNALRDVNVIPTAPNRRVIHTIFIKTASL